MNTVDWLGLALDLEAQAKRVESQTAQRAMLAGARGLRLMDAAGGDSWAAHATGEQGSDLASLERSVAAGGASHGQPQGWSVTVEVDAETVLTISSQHLAGVHDIDRHADTIRMAARHLLAFIGPESAAGGDSLCIERDQQRGTVTVEGIVYAEDLFRDLASALPIGQPFAIMKRQDGVLTVLRLDAGGNRASIAARVHQALTERQQYRTSPENVQDALDALDRLAAGGDPHAAAALDGLAAWLRTQAKHPCATPKNREQWTAWAAAVDATTRR